MLTLTGASEKIEQRINELNQYVREEGMDGIEILSLQSFDTWIKMIDEVLQENLTISLTPSNEIYVVYEDGDIRISLIFYSSGLIKPLDMGNRNTRVAWSWMGDKCKTLKS